MYRMAKEYKLKHRQSMQPDYKLKRDEIDFVPGNSAKSENVCNVRDKTLACIENPMDRSLTGMQDPLGHFPRPMYVSYDDKHPQ